MVVAEQLGRFDTIGIDCVAMNVNDLVCVGAEPLAMVDYLAVDTPTPSAARRSARAWRAGAELAGIEIPGGEIAQVGESSPARAGRRRFGIVALDAIVTGAAIEPGDAVIGLPSSGLTPTATRLRAGLLADCRSDDDRLGRPLGEVLLEPTEIYVKPIVELLRSDVDVRGLAHITSGGLTTSCGWRPRSPTRSTTRCPRRRSSS